MYVLAFLTKEPGRKHSRSPIKTPCRSFSLPLSVSNLVIPPQTLETSTFIPQYSSQKNDRYQETDTRNLTPTEFYDWVGSEDFPVEYQRETNQIVVLSAGKCHSHQGFLLKAKDYRYTSYRKGHDRLEKSLRGLSGVI